MREEDKKKFVVLMEGLGGIYDIEFTKFTVMIWFEALSQNSIEDVSQAVSSYIKSPDFGTYKPKPADIVKMINGTSNDNANLAWSKFNDAIRLVGTARSVVFDDPIIHRVVYDMGGWISMGEKLEKDWPFIAKEFKERYSGYKSRDATPECHSKLIGWVDASNCRNGYEEQPPVLVGNKEKAQNLLNNGSLKVLIELTEAKNIS